MTAVLRRAGYVVNRKRVLRLMRPMGLAAIYPQPALSHPDPDHRLYPYLLRGVTVTGPDQVWSTDFTHLTPTLAAFWLAVFDVAQVVGCARQKKAGLAKLWWKMTEIDIPPLTPEATRAIVETYIARQGMLIEAPGLFVGHVVKQSGGNPQAIADMLDDSSKERRVDKRKIRELRHAAGVRYLDFTPVLIVALAAVVGARYLAIGTGDTELYIFAGMLAAVVISIRVFLFRGAGKAN